MAQTFKSEHGNYSDGFRKAFHHEKISYLRRKDREYVTLETPKLSALLSGTPRQIQSLIPDAEKDGWLQDAATYEWLCPNCTKGGVK